MFHHIFSHSEQICCSIAYTGLEPSSSRRIYWHKQSFGKKTSKGRELGLVLKIALKVNERIYGLNVKYGRGCYKKVAEHHTRDCADLLSKSKQ